jgi:hypothetical protein
VSEPKDGRDDATEKVALELPTEGSERSTSAWVEKRPKYKRRITLELSGPALALPGESEPPPSVEPNPRVRHDAPSTVFTVPAEFRDRPSNPEGPPTPPVPMGILRGNDAWGRSETGAARARSRSSTPPPANHFDAPDSNDALAMVGVTRASGKHEVDFEREMQERFELGDFTGALRAAELVLGTKPSHQRARALADACREKLVALHMARLGGGQRSIERAAAPGDERWLGIDHRAGFMLSQIEGKTSIEELVDISGLPRHDALKLLVELVGAGAVRIK